MLSIPPQAVISEDEVVMSHSGFSSSKVWSKSVLKSIRILLFLISALIAGSTASAQVPPGWTSQDIGAPSVAGTTAYSNGTFTVTAGGNDIWGRSDQFRFVHYPMKTTGIFTARLVGFTVPDQWTKVGVMVRESLAPDSKYVFITLTGANGGGLQARKRGGDETDYDSLGAISTPSWIRIVRYGNLFIFGVSSDGQNWRDIRKVELKVAPTCFAGMAVTAHHWNQVTTATFDNVSASGELKPEGIRYGDGLYGEYFNNMTLSGTAAKTRIDRTVGYEWENDTPLTGVNTDQFSVRWTGEVVAPTTGSYVFSTYSDDGIRLWINNVLIINNWTDHAPTEDLAAPMNLVAGQRYQVKIEFYENGGGATAEFCWAINGQQKEIVPQTNLYSLRPITGRGNGTGLRAEYFNNVTQTTPFALVRTDANIDFNFGSGGPGSGLPVDGFAIRWTGLIEAPATELYVFSTTSDDGVRLFINGQLVIDNWTDHTVTTNDSQPIRLLAGQKYDLRLDYYDRSGPAQIRLQWKRFRRNPETIPQTAFAPAQFPSEAPIPPNTALTAAAMDAGRFLTQATFGPTPEDIVYVMNKGYSAWIDEQFAMPLDPVNAALRARRDDGQGVNIDDTLDRYWMKSVNGRDQLRQRVAFALSQIFVVSGRAATLDGETYGIGSYMDTLNRDAFGNYRTLLQDVTLHPAMGRFLDMMGNDKEDLTAGRQANENYAREVLQLFSVGLYKLNQDGTYQLDAQGRPISTYGQDEVRGFARAFTGWNWGGNTTKTDGNWFYPPVRDTWDLPMEAWPTHHSTSSKLLLQGVTLPAGQNAAQDLQGALDNIFNHPNVGPFIARQLIQRLVTSNPSQGYVSRVAGVFNNNGSGVRGDLKAVVKAILLDDEARNPTTAALPNYGKLREPVIRFVHLMRVLYAWSDNDQYRMGKLDSPDNELGQGPYHAPSVFNFYEPDYRPSGSISQAGLFAPEFKLANETGVVGIANFHRDAIFYGVGYGDDRVRLNFGGYVQLASDPTRLVDTLNLTLMNGRMTSSMRTRLITAFPNLGSNNEARVRELVYLISTSKEFVVQR
jgi:uncharacterized protein (DUF1800 family)